MLAVRLAIVLSALTFTRLPKPPERVVLQTKKYGTVPLDHRAHLARRAPCVTCHGTGPITKIGNFGMAAGHRICRGCHKEARSGPLGCTECHVGVKGL
jgi:hypothetical protein